MFHNKDYNNQNGIIVDSLTCKYINNIDFTAFYNYTISGSFGGSGSGSNLTCNNLLVNIDANITGMINAFALSINNGNLIINSNGNLTTGGDISTIANISGNNLNLIGDINCGLINGYNLSLLFQMINEYFYTNLITPKITAPLIITSEIMNTPNNILTLGDSTIYNLTISNLIYSPNATINNLNVDNLIVNNSYLLIIKNNLKIKN
jgi:hypothetical protein